MLKITLNKRPGSERVASCTGYPTRLFAVRRPAPFLRCYAKQQALRHQRRRAGGRRTNRAVEHHLRTRLGQPAELCLLRYARMRRAQAPLPSLLSEQLGAGGTLSGSAP